MRISDWSSDVCSSALLQQDFRDARDIEFLLQLFPPGQWLGYMKLGFPPRAIDADRPEPVRPETAGRKVYVQRGKSDGDVQRPVFRLLGIDRGMIEILGHPRRFRGTQHVAGIAVRIGHLFDHRIFWRSVVRIAESGKLAVLRSEEHTSELQSLMRISYAVLCLKKKQMNKDETHTEN